MNDIHDFKIFINYKHLNNHSLFLLYIIELNSNDSKMKYKNCTINISIFVAVYKKIKNKKIYSIILSISKI